MSLIFTNASPDIVCGFMSENGTIYKGNEFKNYVPILEEMEFKTTTEVKFNHDNNVCLNIDTHDERASNKKLTPGVKKNKKLDVTANDINVGATELVLNFTDMNLVVYNKYNLPHMLVPLDNEVLKSIYKGKVVILTIHRLNNPNIVSDVYGNNKNYLTNLRLNTQHKKNVEHKHDEFNKVLEFAEKCWTETDYLSSDFRCNSIKIVTVYAINGDKFISSKENISTNLLLMNKGLLISRDTMFEYHENPNNGSDVNLNQFKSDITPGSKFVYIIDNKGMLADRFYNNLGETSLVPNIKRSSQQRDGLYVIRVAENFTLSVDEEYRLEEIDSVNFIYKTREEAEQGADKTALFAQEIKEREMNLQSNLIDAKQSYELKTLTLKKENEELKAESERKSKELELKGKESDLRFSELKREIERMSLNDKANYDRNHYGIKNNYEEKSYERDSFVETLKVGSSVAGILATGYLIYSKLSK